MEQELCGRCPWNLSGESGIGFTPNLTESTFADLPPLVEAPDAPPVSPCDSFIFASDEASSGPARRSPHTRKKSDNHIPRPPNAFILFRSSFIKSQSVSTEVETNHSTLSKIIGMTWKNLPPEERRVWHAKAMDAVAEHKRNFPSYAFRPKHPRGKKVDPDGPSVKPKRKVREVYQDPQRCKKIAELLVEGKKGAELDRAIQEFDKHHVPEIVTRFEAPITARAYRRSSSVPAPNSDDSRGFLSSSPASPASNSRRRRSSSVGAETRASQEHIERQKARSASIFIDTDSASTSDGQVTPPSFDSFSFQSKQEPDLDSFDFSSFSFSNVTSPAPSFGCDPLMIPLSPCSPLESTTFDHKLEPSSPTTYTPVEPMDISAFIANEWLQHGDSANPFGGYPVVDYSAPAFAFPMPTYAAADPGFCSNFKNLGFEEQPYCGAGSDPRARAARGRSGLVHGPVFPLKPHPPPPI
ncbi:Phosphoacetylglucosamine mutase [Mycena venus]|uniref:Phosphoacetylglucosamine mutase n=1 Tax=Mycena venus TaxID=2733690 RepID=A0A8H7CCH9_9AGAR|nr:Phosphoacetylglucosamine mutase [Mycena venus]